MLSEDEKTIYAGSPMGGLWKKDSLDKKWTSLMFREPTLSVGDFILNKKNDSIILIGTGDKISTYRSLFVEKQGVTPAIKGRGVLKSFNKGKDWVSFGLKTFEERVFTKITSSNSNPNYVLAATTDGLFLSHDFGENWTRQVVTDLNKEVITNVTFFNNDSNNESAILSIWGDGIYYNENILNPNYSWKKLTGGLPLSNIGRIEFSLSNKNQEHLTAVFSDLNFNLRGLYVTNDLGKTWRQIKNCPDLMQKQGFHNILLSYHPTSTDTIYIGGSGNRNMHLSSFYKGYKTNNFWNFKPIAEKLHTDFHDVIFSKINNKISYVSNDGGIWKSEDSGKSWINLNSGISISQINSLSRDLNDTDYILAGTFDNGTIKYLGNGIWEQVDGGDGGNIIIAKENPSIVYNIFFSYYIAKSNKSGRRNSFTPTYPKITQKKSSALLSPYDTIDFKSNFIALVADGVYISKDYGEVWELIPFYPEKTNEIFSSISFINEEKIFLGTSLGNVYKLQRIGLNWKIDKIFSLKEEIGVAGGYVTKIEEIAITEEVYISFEIEENNIWICKPNIGGYESFKFNEIFNLNLPNGAIYDVEYYFDDGLNVFIGGEFGVYCYNELDNTLKSLNIGLPNSTVLDIELTPSISKVTVATYGMGIWELNYKY